MRTYLFPSLEDLLPEVPLATSSDSISFSDPNLNEERKLCFSTNLALI